MCTCVCVCVCMCVYVCVCFSVYTQTHTHTHTPSSFLWDESLYVTGRVGLCPGQEGGKYL